MNDQKTTAAMFPELNMPTMTFRQYAAVHAMRLVLEKDGSWYPDDAADEAVQMADALIAALEKKGGKGE